MHPKGTGTSLIWHTNSLWKQKLWEKICRQTKKAQYIHLILPYKRHIFHSGRENIQQYSLPKTDRHDLPKHADPHNKFALASKKGCFHAFWSGMIYLGGLYDTKIANRIQSLSPAGQCLQFHPSLWRLILQHAVFSASAALSSGSHGSCTGHSAGDNSVQLLGEASSCWLKVNTRCTETKVKHSAVLRFIPITLIKENTRVAPFVETVVTDVTSQVCTGP